MGRKNLSQEGLKAIACGAMLLDHIGAVFLPGVALRCIGRISFPIFCFLLAEGANHTRSPGKYALRLALGALIAEIPYDGLFYGGFCREHQNVMFTLLLGLLTLRSMERWPGFGLLSLMAGCLLAELGHTSYGGWGVAMVVLFARTARLPRRELWQLGGYGCDFSGHGRCTAPRLGHPHPDIRAGCIGAHKLLFRQESHPSPPDPMGILPVLPRPPGGTVADSEYDWMISGEIQGNFSSISLRMRFFAVY